MLARIAATTAATALTALALGLPAPSYADSIGAKDPSDVAHGVDLRAVQVQNTDSFVRVVLVHEDLDPSPESGAGGAVYLDTDAEDRGPELVFLGGYFEGTDYQLLETEGFGQKRWGDIVDGSWRMRLDFDKEHTVMRIARDAVGADDVRVAVKVAGTQPDGDRVTDWLRGPRELTEWVARG